MIYDFMKDSRYISIMNNFTQDVKRIREKVMNDVKSERITKDIKEAKQQAMTALDEFYKQKAKEYKSEREGIEQAYKNKKQKYSDPQAELLDRQDFDIKMQIASDRELEDILKDPVTSLSEHQFNRLQIEYKNRGLDLNPFAQIRSQKHIGKEYLDDPNYKAVAESEQKLNATKGHGGMVWVSNGERPQAISLGFIDGIMHKKFRTEALDQLEQGTERLNRMAKEQNSVKASYNTIVKKEAEAYADDVIKQGKTLDFKEYKDVDPRAIRGTDDYDVTHEFKYLKERYHDNSNPLYHIRDDNYSVVKHLEYLRKKHADYLSEHPETEKEIETIKEQGEPEPATE